MLMLACKCLNAFLSEILGLVGFPILFSKWDITCFAQKKMIKIIKLNFQTSIHEVCPL